MMYAPDTSPPPCIHCFKPCRQTNGAEIYPSRRDLAKLVMWKCDSCAAYVGSHKSTGKPLGYAANAKLRNARQEVHKVLDPIWQTADTACGYEPEDEKARNTIRRAARKRVYAWLADQMGLSAYECHTARFDLNACRQAWRLLKPITYPEIRKWAKARETKAQNEKETTHV